MPDSDDDNAHPSARSQRGLDWLTFFIADVQTGFGPFVAVYLAARHWPQGEIGLVLSIGAIIGVASQIPGGAIVDAVASKRLLIASALAMIACGALIFAIWPSFVPVVVAEVLHGATAGLIKPSLVAVGLGLVGHRAFSRRLGRNHRYNSLGNALTAAGMGLVGYLIAKRWTFVFAAALCAPALLALTRIDGREIDYARARAAPARDKPRDTAPLLALLRNRNLLVFAACLVLFQFANAGVMPLASERLGQAHGSESELVTSALVIVPQLVSAAIATWIAARADVWGRKPLLLAGFAVLPLRVALFAVAPGPWYLVPVQALGGVTAAIIGVMMPLVVADVTRRSGRYNLSLGALGAATGIGAAVSTTATSYVAQFLGYAAGYAVLAAAGAIALGLVWRLLPETQPEEHRPDARRRAGRAL